MTKTTKKKIVSKEVLYNYELPNDETEIVQVVASKGNNLHEVKNCKEELFLVSMPTKFRNNIWIKRDDYIMITKIIEGDRVKGEISNILYPPQIEYIFQQGLWPTNFKFNFRSQIGKESLIPDDMLPPDCNSDDDYYYDDENDKMIKSIDGNTDDQNIKVAKPLEKTLNEVLISDENG